MQKKSVTFKQRLEYVVFNAFAFMIKISPIFTVKWHRRLLAFLFLKSVKRYRRIVEKNLSIAFPQVQAEEKTRLLTQIYLHFASIFLEIVCYFVKKKPGKILKNIEIINLQVLEEALKKEKGVILFSGHFGNWELVPYILNRKLNRPVNSITRKMNNPLVEKKVREFREYMGSRVIDKKNSLRTILNRLKENGIIFLLIDQHTIRQEAVPTIFFGEKVGVVPTVSQLKIRKEIPVIPIFLHYEKEKIVMELLEEIKAPGGDDPEHDILLMTQECTALIEEKVRRFPEQWFWFHDRWKDKPLRPQDSPGPQIKSQEGIPNEKR